MSHSPDLSHVRWLGGGSGAGKSVVARRIALAHDVALYDTDKMMSAHAERCSSTSAPLLADFLAMSMDERWVNRTPQVMADTFHWFNGEGFDLFVEDLLTMSRDRLILVEGFRLLPKRVAPLLLNKRHALWLLPTPDFRRRAFQCRGTTMDIANRTTNPKRALANLLARDAFFTERLGADIDALGLHKMDVDGTLEEVELATRVATTLLA